jgi:hypothetical protein
MKLTQFGLSPSTRLRTGLSKPLARMETLRQAQGERFCKLTAAKYKSTNQIASNE